MKHCALTILALLYILTCLAQEYNEVVFEVRKPKQVNTYYYKETTRDWKTKDGATLSFLCSQNEGDTFHFYSLNAFSLDSISDIRTSLKHRKDTVNVKYLYHSYYSKYGDTIIERKTGTDGRSHGHLIFCDSAYEMRQGLIPHKVYKRGKIGRATYMANKNVEIKVGDSIFTCIKVLEIDAHIRGGEIWSKGIMVSRTRQRVYNRTYYYFREKDYLLVKIEHAAEVTKVEPYAVYKPMLPIMELYKAIE